MIKNFVNYTAMNIGTITKKIRSGIVLLALCPSLYAQHNDARQRIEAAKIALISQRMELSPEEAQMFWPIYNEYNEKRHSNRIAYEGIRRNFDPQKATEKETEDMLKLERQVKEKQFSLDKEYSEKMLKIINAKQLMSLHNAEREFKKMLLQRLEHRRKQRGHIMDGPVKRKNEGRMRP